MIDRISRHLAVNFNTAKKRIGRAYLTACVEILLGMNASTKLWYNCGQKLYGGKYDRFCLSVKKSNAINGYTVNVRGTTYSIRLGQFFGDNICTLHVSNAEMLSKLYNHLLKHKNEDLSLNK